jgi:hypothetical protein
VVVSPLLNLAPSSASGPTLVHSRPLLPLGTGGLAGSATLSLAPDRRSVEVSVRLEGGATASAIRLRRVASHHLSGGSGSWESDFLVIEVVGASAGEGRTCLRERFSLDERGSIPPFERVSDLRKLGIEAAGLMASSIDGLRVEGAADAGASSYYAERMLTEIEAAERSTGVAAACRHLELANLYARRLGSGEPHAGA